MENLMTIEEKDAMIKQLEDDIKYVDNNLMNISSGIVMEIGKLEKLKKGIDINQFEGIKIDRNSNSAQIFNLEVFERQLARKSVEVSEEITRKQTFISFLSSEHSRIKAIKTELEIKLTKLKNTIIKKSVTSTPKKSAGIQLNFENQTKK